jgi:hypothetical protein
MPSPNSLLRPIFGSLMISLSLAACVSNEQILRSGKETPTPGASATNVPSAVSPIDREIQAMRDADFRFVWIVRRKDGGQITPGDKALIRANTVEMNRRVLSDDGQAVVIGSNVVPAKESVETIFSNFSVEDLSTEPMPSPLPTRDKNAKGAKTAQ